MLRYLIFLIVQTIIFSAQAQLYETGIHAGFNLDRFTIDNNDLGNGVVANSGRFKAGASAGVQFLYSPPRNQKAKPIRIIPAFMFEATLCQCGGQINSSTTNPDGSRTFRELDFTLLRGDYSIKFVAMMKKLRVMLGPTVTNFFSTEFTVNRSPEAFDAAAFFNPQIIGYEFGIGLRLKSLEISGRIQNNITAFGKSSPLLETEMGNNHLRFVLSYYIFEKHRGKYWDSIYWD